MITLLSPNYVAQETTRKDLSIAAIAWGFTIGFGFLTVWTAFKQTAEIASRYGIRKLNQPYIWMIWSEIIACLAFSIICWLHLVAVIPPSVTFFGGILLLWALQVQFLLQIIINRIAMLLPDQRKAKRLKIGVAIFITAINISVYCIWVPARLQINDRYIRVNDAWDRCEKVLYLMTDATLNWYFMHTVQKQLVEQGLKKYDRVVLFNKMTIGLSLSMDCLIIGMMSLENSFVYMQFHPLAYIVKLNIEMSMASLIVRVSRDTRTIKLRRAKNGDISYYLAKHRPKTPTYSGLTRVSSTFDRTWVTNAPSINESFDESNDLTKLDSQTWKKYMGRYQGEYQHDIRAHTKTVMTVSLPEEIEVDIEGLGFEGVSRFGPQSDQKRKLMKTSEYINAA